MGTLKGQPMRYVETVTVLITDVVDSTALESRIGPARADVLRNEHFELIRTAVQEAGGKEVKNTGDGLMVAFRSTVAAVSCAVSVQQRLERRNRDADEPLWLRIGLSCGDATVAEGEYFGLPVVEATRLCAYCSGGQILANALVAHLSVGSEHTLTPVGDLELKGLPAPLPAVEVTWEPLAPDEPLLPLPAQLQIVPRSGFVGRVDEAERLRRLFSEAAGGERRVALIAGEPGIGKTRLSTHMALEARGDGATVLYGRCDKELGVPYGPWVEALGHYVEHAPEEVLRSHVRRHGGELSRSVGQLRARLPGLPPARAADPETERYLLWNAVVGLLAEATTSQPLVLIVDDLHWADKPTLMLLRHLIAEAGAARALIIGTYRDSDLDREHPLTELLAELHRLEGIERLAIGGLSELEIIEIMERAGGHELDQPGLALAHELFKETDGNPFYTGELLRHLRESGTIYQRDNGRFTVRGEPSALELPQSVREVVERRVERLGQHAHSVLSVAAVIGREFDLELLEMVTGSSADELLEMLEQAVAASVLVESATAPGRFSFAHALINHTLYVDLGTTRRARLHRRVGEALERLLGSDPGARMGELALHWGRVGGAADRPKAIGYARAAGERALEELAPDEALRWFEHALGLLTADGGQSERCDLLLGLGQAQRQLGDPAFRETLLQACALASELGDADRAARAALANNRGQVSAFGQVDRDRLAALERALELGAADGARSASLISVRAVELQNDPDHERRRALAEQALALAQEAGDPRTLAQVLKDCSFALWSPDTLDRRRTVAKELLDVATQLRDPSLDFWASSVALHVNIESCDLTHAQAARERAEAIAQELGQPSLRWFATVYGAGWAFMRGELDEGERLSEQALAIGTEAGEPDAMMVYGAQLGGLRYYQGRAGDMLEMMEAGVAANPGISAWRSALASMYCWGGRLADGGAIVADAARDGFAHVPWDNYRMNALALYADAASQAGVTDAAGTLYDLIEPWPDQLIWNQVLCYGHARMYLGMLAATLGRHALADEHFAAVCDFYDANQLLFWVARGRLAWAEALAARGEARRASEEAERALVPARRHAFGAIEARAAALVSATPVASRGPSISIGHGRGPN
jgi:class 3 adenylate cyclase/tetratricopeptide (TPR) repeat protein